MSELDDLDDIGLIKQEFMSKIIPDDEFNSSQVPVDTITRREVQDLIESIPKPLVQRPMQPGSSPNDEDNRFLCWNNTGIIRAQFGKSDQSIDVMFHDTEKHSSVNFRNEPNYTFGSLSEDVVVVGSNGKYETGPASIHGINLMEADRDKREWEIELPHVELIEALSAGQGFVAAATDHKFLRLFTNGGMQSNVLSLPGQVLCMSAHGHSLLIIYHNGAGHSDDQNLTMLVYQLDVMSDYVIRQVHAHVPVSLSKRSPLAWAGFSDEGTPCTYDYAGMLRMYRVDLGKSWYPLLDLRQLTSSALDHYFVVGVSELNQVVRAVKCKRSRYPEFSCETADVFSFSLPMCDLDTDKGKLEEELVRLRMAELSYRRLAMLDGLGLGAESSADANEKLLVNAVLRLFAIYLKEDKEDLAKSLVWLMPRHHTSKLPEFAWKTNRRQHFLDSLTRAVEEREELDLELQHRVAAGGRGYKVDDLDSASVASGASSHRSLRKSATATPSADTLRPIPLEQLVADRTRNLFASSMKRKRKSSSGDPDEFDSDFDKDDAGDVDEEDNQKPANNNINNNNNENENKLASKKPTKPVSHNLFSTKTKKVRQ